MTYYQLVTILNERHISGKNAKALLFSIIVIERLIPKIHTVMTKMALQERNVDEMVNIK